jgi:phospholipid/cholesterol/gamma-HCH transport system substrate-binding protein
MEAEAKYTYVGAAVVVLIATLIGAVLWLKRAGTESDFRRYTVYFQEQALDGLAVGSDVNMRGISVGRVLDYQLSPDKLNRARVDLRLDRRAPVRQNTSAVITRNFVTGIAQIRLVTTEPAGEPLTEAPEGERYPVIAEGRSDVAELTGRVTELGDMAGEAMERLSLVLSIENRNNFAATLGNLRELTDGLKKQLVGIDRLIADIGGAARESRRAAADVAVATGKLSASADLTLQDTRALIGDLRSATAETQKAVAEVSAAAAAVKTDAAGAARRLDASIEHFDEQLLVAVTELRASLETVQRSLDRLADPRAAVFGPEPSRLGPGEKLR